MVAIVAGVRSALLLPVSAPRGLNLKRGFWVGLPPIRGWSGEGDTESIRMMGSTVFWGFRPGGGRRKAKPRLWERTGVIERRMWDLNPRGALAPHAFQACDIGR